MRSLIDVVHTRPLTSLVLCQALLCIVVFEQRSAAECPMGQPMDRVITISKGSIPMTDLWNMGADDFGVSGDRLVVRVSPPMLAELSARSIPHEIICNDLHQASREHAEREAVTRAEVFGKYHDLPGVQAAMSRIAQEHPDLVALVEIGRSIEGRPIQALRISDQAATIDPQEPGMVIMGCHHAREWISVEVPLYFADYLANNYRKNGAVTRLLNHTELWIIPVLNPDGFAYTWVDFPNSFQNRWWRKNRRDNRDGTFGVDPNRNYLIGFGDEAGSSSLTFSEVYRGTEPFSEPETKAIRDLMSGVTFKRSFATALSYHNFSQLVMYPNGYSFAPVENVDYYRELAAEMTRLINASHTDPRHDYIWGQAPDLLYVITGGFEDWAHHTLGATSLIIELRPADFPYFELPAAEIIPTCQENLPAFLYLAEETLIPGLKAADSDEDGFVGTDDSCPDSPKRAAVDERGCAATEQDLDNDGILNTDDACQDSAEGQKVDASGCRVSVQFAVSVSANVRGAAIDLVPADIDSAQSGQADPNGFNLEYGEITTVALTAPTTFEGNHFLHWTINGEPQADGAVTVRVEGVADSAVQAVYRYPVRVEVDGPRRVPDQRASGLAFSWRYAVRAVYNDGSVETTGVPFEWTSSNSGVAALTAEGDLLAFEVPAAAGEVSTELSAKVSFGERIFETAPFSVTIFDAETRRYHCESLTISGPDRVGSLSTATWSAAVAFEADEQGSRPTDEALWTVETAEQTTSLVGLGVLSADGSFTAEWVAQDQNVTIVAAFVNDDRSVCLAQKLIVIVAGNPGDDPAARPVASNSGTCGAMGLLAMIGIFAGLVGFRALTS